MKWLSVKKYKPNPSTLYWVRILDESGNICFRPASFSQHGGWITMVGAVEITHFSQIDPIEIEEKNSVSILLHDIKNLLKEALYGADSWPHVFKEMSKLIRDYENKEK